MPIEHINKTDTLNEGREKLNAAIDGANAADVTSKAADTKATQALANSESTQTQLDTIVIDGDSSVEAAQARVDEKGVPHTTLKARIDDGFEKTSQQLAENTKDIRERGLNFKTLGAKGDGISDDTPILMNVISEGNTVYVPSGNYKINPNEIINSDVSIDIIGAEGTPTFIGDGGDFLKVTKNITFRNIKFENYGTVFNATDFQDDDIIISECKFKDVRFPLKAHKPSGTHTPKNVVFDNNTVENYIVAVWFTNRFENFRAKNNRLYNGLMGSFIVGWGFDNDNDLEMYSDRENVLISENYSKNIYNDGSLFFTTTLPHPTFSNQAKFAMVHGSHAKILNNTIDGVDHIGNEVETDVEGIYTKAIYSHIIGNVLKNAHRTESAIASKGAGRTSEDKRVGFGVVITDNIVYDTENRNGGGIRTRGDANLVSDNYIYLQPNSSFGISVDTGVNEGSTTVHNNMIEGAGADSIRVLNAYGESVSVENNTINNALATGIRYRASEPTHLKMLVLRDNLINGKNKDTTGTGINIDMSSSAILDLAIIDDNIVTDFNVAINRRVASGSATRGTSNGNIIRDCNTYGAGSFVNPEIGLTQATDATSKATGNRSIVQASSNSDATGSTSGVITSNGSNTTQSSSLLLSSLNTTNNTRYTVAMGYEPNGEASVNNTKIRLTSENGNITHAGQVYSGHDFSDFAELFPNLTGVEQGNGLLQTLDGEGVRPSQEGDSILGVTSATAGIILGDTPFSWQGRWLIDEFGAYIYEDVWDQESEEYVKFPKENPNYNPELEFTSRIERPNEWSIVGLIGQVYVRVTEDVKTGDFITPYSDGIGTTSNEVTNMKVMKITTPFDSVKGYAVAYCLLK